MKNITLAIDDELLERSRELAGKRGVTLNAMVRTFLSDAVAQDERIANAKRGLQRLMDESTADMGRDYKWNRDEIYAEREDRLFSRLEHPPVRGGREGQ